MFRIESNLARKALGAAAALSCLAPIASAAALVATPIDSPPTQLNNDKCSVDAQAATAGLTSMPAGMRQDKSAAILGGMSALELMRSDQITFAQPQAENAVTQDVLQVAMSLEPAIGGFADHRRDCEGGGRVAALARPGLNQLPSAAPRPADFLQSRRVPIGSTRFDAQWHRVNRSSLSSRQYSRAIGSKPVHGIALLGQVNAWVNNNIAYVEDAQLWGSPDYWATASETMKRARGDCEDLAIVKMKILERAGFRREDMFLTVARDLYRNADHAFLVVKLNGQFHVLDNAVDHVLPADQDLGYRPILSFNSSRSYLHGY